MLRVPLDIHSQRQNSVSSCNDQSFDPRKLSATVDEQKRVIRKLNLKITKLEEALKKQRKEVKQAKVSSMCDIPMDAQFSVLKDEIERSNQLQQALDKLSNQTAQILNLISGITGSPVKRQLPTMPSCKSLPSIDISCRQDSTDGNQIFRKAQRVISNLSVISKNVQKQKESVSDLEQQNSKLKVELEKMKKIIQKNRQEIQELKQFKNQYQIQRKNRIKLKSLLEKSQYERNNNLTKIHRMSSKQKELVKSTQEWISLSKSLTCRISHLEKEKKEIQEENLKDKERWGHKYKEFLKKVRNHKHKLQDPDKNQK